MESLVTAQQSTAEHYFGEATVTSKGQITVPSALRQALGVTAGDRLRFVQAPDGSIRLEARKRRRIVDFARANAFRAAKRASISTRRSTKRSLAAMAERERRSRQG
jgi:AbrB family looped-hinge helix DNA binding protein